MAYSAEEHGWSSSAFHDHVNTYGATVIVAETAGGAVCGGYNPRGWIGNFLIGQGGLLIVAAQHTCNAGWTKWWYGVVCAR